MTDIALVCGANGALGEATVRAFASRGDTVVAVVRERSDGAAAAAVVEHADLAVPGEVDALWQRLEAAGTLPRWVVNTAGGYRGGTVADSDPDSYRFLHDLNLATAWWSCRAAARHLPAGGGIVNVGSRTAVSGGAGAAAYAVTKAAVVRLTQVLAAELADRRIRVNAVLPSVMDTAANRATMSAAALARAVPTDDVAAVVAFLCSDAARAVTGAVVPTYGS